MIALDFFRKALEGGPDAKDCYERAWEELRRELYPRACAQAPSLALDRDDVQEAISLAIRKTWEKYQAGLLKGAEDIVRYTNHILLRDSRRKSDSRTVPSILKQIAHRKWKKWKLE